jgi:hypothetical protein
MTTDHPAFEIAERLAPQPTSRDASATDWARYVVRCDFGGRAVRTSTGLPEFRPYCHTPPAYRYRPSAAAAGHWGFRCAPHAAVLDSAFCTIERLEDSDD